jgi:PKD repeat protein
LQAAFESDLQEVTIGESITFKDISTGEPSKWNWRFEGGEPETSILFSPNVVYNKPGVYSVTLSVGRGEEANEMVKEQYITVNYPSQITVTSLQIKLLLQMKMLFLLRFVQRLSE